MRVRVRAAAVAVSASVLLVLAGCGSPTPGTPTMATSAAHAQPFTATGSLDLSHSCSTSGSGYSDIQIGAQVVVKVDGKTVAVGFVGSGTPNGYGSCTFTFSVPGVPAGEKFYELEVTHRGGLEYSEEQLRQGVALTLGG